MPQFLRLSSVACAFLSVGCMHQPLDYSADFQQLHTVVDQQQVQVKQIGQGQQNILQQLENLQQQVVEQQKLLEAKPQVIERITRVECPPLKSQKPPQPVPKAPDTDKQIIGMRENVLLTGVDLVMAAKVSPQLNNSILDARNIQMFERNSEEWVRFTLYNPETKEPHVLERKLMGFQNVQSANKTAERRPVVEMRFTIGKLTQRGQFVLTDRSDSAYPIVLAKNLLRDVMLVDVSGENLAPLVREEKKESSDKK
jgi:hypothetical protein